jgi:hypothetical protein
MDAEVILPLMNQTSQNQLYTSRSNFSLSGCRINSVFDFWKGKSEERKTQKPMKC